MRKNLLASALVLRYMGLSPEKIAAAMASFPGVEHRLEFFARARGVSWYNDSAATIPQAVEAALDSFSAPVVLITGGTDKNLEFEPTKKAYAKAKAIVLLEGTGTEKLMPLLAEQGISWKGPYGSLDAAVNAADRLARPGQAVLLSPGCASFGMFLHEFDRGKKFKEAVRARLGLS
jgi:UDP-N-acetylmuramoylalanine--D-glutamate ligase